MAVSFASPYKGPGRGFIYTISSSHSTASSAGLAPAPVAAMGSVSRGAGLSRSRGVSSTMGSIGVAMPVAVAPMSGIRTAAATVSGGVTTYDKAPKKPRGGVRNVTHPGNPDDGECPTCEYGEDGFCIHCGHSIYLDLNDDGSCAGHCGDDGCEGGCCCTPLELNWGAMVFLALLAGGYGVRASMREKCTMKENENRA